MNKLLKNEDPRIQRTRQAFEDALLSLLKKVDFNKITVSALAKEANLNRATFYLHYEDKDDLLESYLSKSLDRLKEHAIIPHDEFRFSTTEPHPLFVRIFKCLEKDYRFFKIMLARKTESPILYSVIHIIESFIESSNEQMQAHGIHFDVEQPLSKTYFTYAYLGTIIWWLENDMPYSPKHMAEQLTKLSTVGPYERNPFFSYEKERKKYLAQAGSHKDASVN